MNNVKIGSFYKTQINGKMEFGIVDRLPMVDGVEMVSFLYSHEFMWAGKLCRKEDMSEVHGDEREKAMKSAIRYWVYEIESLENRIAMEYADDDIEKLKTLLATSKVWLARLK